MTEQQTPPSDVGPMHSELFRGKVKLGRFIITLVPLVAAYSAASELLPPIIGEPAAAGVASFVLLAGLMLSTEFYSPSTPKRAFTLHLKRALAYGAFFGAGTYLLKTYVF